MTVEILDKLPIEEHIPTLLTIQDFLLILTALFMLVITAYLFEFLVVHMVNVVRVLSRRKATIADLENNKWIKSIKESQFGIRYIRGGRIGRK